MKHLGDITKIKNAPFVDCVTFGSPCQDLSIAGKRVGLLGERSSLFIEATRIIKEMRLQSGGLYPTFAIWENVPGAFSSNRGEDFRTVLEELSRIKEPEVSISRPENGKWAKAGFICGNEFSLAWRTFDAQFWGVPQRRRRIAVVVDFAGQRAGDILFERTGVSGHLEPIIPPWEGIARNPAQSVAGYDRVVEGADIYNGSVTGNVAASLTTATGQGAANTGPTVLCRAQANSNAETYENLSPALTACHDGQPIVFESHSQDARYTQQSHTSPACTAQWGTGGNNMQIVAEPMVIESNQVHATITNNGVCPTLSASMGMGGGYVPMITRKISFSSSGFGAYNESIGTLRASGGDNGCGSENIIAEKRLHLIVRRLTPTECERMQGFPDGFTDIGEWHDSTTGQAYWFDTKGKKHKTADSPRYKALGNSIALPQWWWIICKMAAYLHERATLGSLFDGIGGFPLVWEKLHGKGTAVWASEIEEFPIAVTKENFK